MFSLVRLYRNSCKFTQEELAYICNVDRATIMRLEYERNVANALLANKLDYVFGIYEPGCYVLTESDMQELDDRILQVVDGSWLWLRKKGYESTT